MIKAVPNILMAVGAAALLGEAAFFTNGVHRGVLFGALIAAGVGYFWERFYPGAK